MSDPGVAVVIEDDLDVRNLLEGVLSQAGFRVHTAPDGVHGVQAVRDSNPDIVTLDVGLPDVDGFEVLRRLRHFSDAYVVMLTGRTEEADLLTALQGGADDYITKPIRPREVRARITAMMRRPRRNVSDEHQGPTTPQPAIAAQQSIKALRPDHFMRYNGLILDAEKRTVTLEGEPLDLTRSEFGILHELLRGAGAVLARAQLVRVIRGQHYAEDTYVSKSDERAVEVHIGNLRRKLRDDPESPRWLQTVRGVGYRIVTNSKPAS